MKLIKSLAVIFAICLFSGCLFAIDPNKKDHTVNMDANLLKRLESFVVLTDSQKTIIQSRTHNYVLNLKNADAQTDANLSRVNKERIVLDYRAMLDSVLTNEQKAIIEVKRIERIKSQQKQNL